MGSRQQLNKATHTTINVIGESIKRSTKVKYLGGHLDSNLTFKDHILIKCKAATLNIIKICNINVRKYKRNMPQTNSATGCITPRLWKPNASRNMKIMQKVQNTAAMLILRKNAKESTTECLKTLHRLPIQPRIDKKYALSFHKYCTKQDPAYLQNLIQEKTTNHPSLRSENKKALLVVPNIQKQTFTSRSFSVYDPKLWNSLPDKIREEIIFEKLKKNLKHISLQLHTWEVLSIMPGIHKVLYQITNYYYKYVYLGRLLYFTT